jgi:hypothetical protein
MDPQGRATTPFLATTDNSNTQFAILALAIASRWDVPVERTMKLVLRRFETSQDPGGGWDYPYRFGGGGEYGSMACVGLIGLGVAHALTTPDAAALKEHLQDPHITNGLAALSKYIGTPAGQWQNHPQANRYFLWSLERVGVLYDLPLIGDKDWYRWGAEILVANQQADYSWTRSDFPGSGPLADTCMALLFLKKANLVKELTSKLRTDDLAKTVAPQVEPASPAPQPQPVALPKAPDAPLAPAPVPTPVVSTPAKTGNSKLWLWIGLGCLTLIVLGGSTILVLRSYRRRATLEADSEEHEEEGLVEVEALNPKSNRSSNPVKKRSQQGAAKSQRKVRQEARSKK